tara:strand:+ start:231 stop:425 length:195 start_codon:yes stop_codon:yes gene_type:complete
MIILKIGTAYANHPNTSAALVRRYAANTGAITHDMAVITDSRLYRITHIAARTLSIQLHSARQS